MTGLDLAKAVDVASAALTAFLKLSGPLYRPSDAGSVWVYDLDDSEPLGFQMFAAHLASAASIPDQPIVPTPTVPTPVVPVTTTP